MRTHSSENIFAETDNADSTKYTIPEVPQTENSIGNILGSMDEYSDPDFEEDEDEVPLDPSTSMTHLITSEALLSEREIKISWTKMLQNNPLLSPEIRERAIKHILHFNYTFQLTSDAFHNAIMYFNLVLSRTHIELSEMDLFAATCYHLASKVDTRIPIAPAKFNALIGTEFTVQDIAAMEVKIVIALGFKLSYPTAKLFMRGIIQEIDAPSEVIELTNVLVELAMMIIEFVEILPSIQATSAVAVSCGSIGRFDLAKHVIAMSPHANERLVPCIIGMIKCGRNFVKRKGATGASTQEFLAKLNFNFGPEALL